MAKPTKEPVVNSALRQWTRGVSFTLAMGKTQVATLVALHLSQDSAWLIGGSHPTLRHFVTGSRALQERGLIEFHPDRVHRSSAETWRDHHPLTPAGELVIGLFKLSGIYDEIRVELETPVVRHYARTA